MPSGNIADWVMVEPFKLLENVNILFQRRDFSIAIIGFGKMGLLHSALLNLLCKGSVRYIVDKSILVRLGGGFLFKNVEFLRDIENLVNLKEKLDAIYITTPPQTHFYIARRLLEAGFKNIFLEKPPVINIQQYDELFDLAKGSNVMIGFQKRFALPFHHARLLLGIGALGELKNVYISIKSGDVLERTNRFRNIGRGVLLDLGIHAIDLLCWLFNEEINVTFAKYKSAYSGVDDYFEATLIAKENTKIYFETTWSDPEYRLPETSLKIIGTKGELHISEDFLRAKLYKACDDGKDYELALYRPHYYRSFPPVLIADHEYTIENMHFLSTIENHSKSYTSLEACRCAMTVLEDLYTRVKHG